ncbi:PREDICTED: C-X-C chemokine receptor type 2-like [Cyprinodon variegatus]|uniref:C-X-C chemokine receptor type 2-like n=1 Tax=Cyprinodon variegatus TaxID=28743 RepID=UPI0007428CE0|nr:PREDICTED: C-X-C chemokine receptor type 2-like [Cyprinodon variegatus]
MDASNFTGLISNVSDVSDLPQSLWNLQLLFPALVLSLCFLLGVPGNITVIILKPNWRNLSSLSQSLILNLAISDLLCLLTLPLWIYSYLFGWPFDLITCKLVSYLVYCSIYGSLLTVTGLSIQRYLVVVRQRRCHQVQRRMLLFMLWLVSIILSIPALMVRNLRTNQHWISCEAQYSSAFQQVAVLLAETVFGFVSISLVALSCVFLYRKVHQTAFFNHSQTTKLLSSIIVSFFVLWAPYHTINLMGVAAVCLKNDALLKLFREIVDIYKAVTFINSCLNPLLYAFTSRKMSMFCKKIKQLQHKIRNKQPQISVIAEP